LLRRLRDEGVLSQEIYQLFGEVRRAGNMASHAIQGDSPTALNILKMGWQLGIWFHSAFLKEDFMAGAFVEPSGKNEVEALLKEREELAAKADKLPPGGNDLQLLINIEGRQILPASLFIWMRRRPAS
jgi:hypothetical protein